MNKNHLLPALLFVLAACGPATSSSAPASSAPGPVDNNEYRFVGGQANIGSWTPGNAPVLAQLERDDNVANQFQLELVFQ